MEWVSDRKKQEWLREEKIKIFDDFVDLAIEGVITIDQAILGYKKSVLITEEQLGKVA